MKQCPQCGSMYSDDTLNFCLSDRTSLVPVSETEGADTVVRERDGAQQTRVLSAAAGVAPLFKYLAIGLGVLLLLLAGAGLAAWSFWNSRSAVVQTQQPNNSSTPATGAAASRAVSNNANTANSTNKETNRAETPSPTKTPTPESTRAADEAPQKDAGTGRITFKKGSVSQSMSGTVVHDRSYVLRTMAGQTLSARVSSRDGCVEFDGGGSSVSFQTPNGDVSLNLVNTCDDPAPFTMNVTVK